MASHTLPKTVGHHFSDLLICKQKAWLHYHGDHHQKMPPPVHLRSLQVEGQHIEELVYQNRYPGGVMIPGFRAAKPAERLAKTQKAMRLGEKAILQGYIQTDLGEGTLDVMELIGQDDKSLAGFSYRVGEIKRSETLKTAHIMQVLWYTELLSQSFGQIVHEGFFILGVDGEHILTVDLDAHRGDYELLKADLFRLRDCDRDPGPHLIQACLSCEWRGVCMKRLIAEKHLSLAPALTPAQAEDLREQGFLTWESLVDIDDTALSEAGMGDLEIAVLRRGLDRLSKNMAPIRSLLRIDIFDKATVAVLEYPELISQSNREEPLQATAIHYEAGNTNQSIHVQYDENGKPQADLSPLNGIGKLVFYGGLDIGPFLDMQRNQPNHFKVQVINLVDFIENYVHYPFIGLELDTLTGIINGNQARLRGRDRVPAIRQVLEWIRSSL